jgi:hypothetical protein
MNYADFFTSANGMPIESDATLGFMQTDYQSALNGLAQAFAGNGVIVSGCVDSGAAVSDGWIYVGSQLYRFEGGAKAATYYIDEIVVSKANQSGALIERYFTRTAKFGTGNQQGNWADLVRLESLFNLQSRVLDALTPESAVVLAGMAVTNVTATTLDISAGSAIVDRKFVMGTAYMGGFPVYLTALGTWVNTPPVGPHIAFNPHTAQRLPDVMRRAGTPSGEIVMRAALSDRFDNTGLGRWEMTGWAICNGANGTVDLRSRFVAGYDPRNTDPGGNIWDATYNTPGNAGGAKAHTLTVAEMPEHRHGPFPIPEGGAGVIRRTIQGENYTVTATDSNGSGIQPDLLTEPLAINVEGGSQPHENRPPFRVVVFIQRI